MYSEQEIYNQSIAHVLKLSYKEALARGIFWGSVSISTVNKTNFHQSIACVLKLSYKEVLARRIFWGSMSICAVNKKNITNQKHVYLN